MKLLEKTKYLTLSFMRVYSFKIVEAGKAPYVFVAAC